MSEGSAQLILETVRLIQTDINQLHEKINKTNIDVAKISVSLDNIDKKVNKIDDEHHNCDGKKALSILQEKKGEDKVKDSNSYKIGAFVFVLTLISGFIFGVVSIFKK